VAVTTAFLSPHPAVLAHPLQYDSHLIHRLPDLLQVPAPRRAYPGFALGGIALRKLGIEALNGLALPTEVAVVVKSQVLDAVEPGRCLGRCFQYALGCPLLFYRPYTNIHCCHSPQNNHGRAWVMTYDK
jgi:hypothetical protein